MTALHGNYSRFVRSAHATFHPVGSGVTHALLGQVTHITDARERCARLTNIANDLIKEVEHVIKYPDEANGATTARRPALERDHAMEPV